MRKRVFTRILSLLLVCVMVLTIIPVEYVHANIKDPRFDGTYPPENKLYSPDEYPSAGKSDVNSTTPVFTGDYDAVPDPADTDPDSLDNPDDTYKDSADDVMEYPDEISTDGGKQNIVVLPAIFVEYKSYYISGLNNALTPAEKDSLIRRTLNVRVGKSYPLTSNINSSVKFISYLSINNNNGNTFNRGSGLETMHSTNMFGSEFNNFVKNSGGYIAEEAFADNNTQNLTALGLLQEKLLNLPNLYAYDANHELQYFAWALRDSCKDRKTSFNDSSIKSNIDSVAAYARASSNDIPVIVFWSGFFEFDYNRLNEAGYTGEWRAVNSHFGTYNYARSWNSVTQYYATTANRSVVSSNQTYGRAAKVAFQQNDIKQNLWYYNKDLQSSLLSNSFSDLNETDYDFFGKSYITYSNSSEGTKISSPLGFRCNVTSLSGIRKSNDPKDTENYYRLVTPGTLETYDKIIGVHFVSISGKDDTRKIVDSLSGVTWDISISTYKKYSVELDNTIDYDIESYGIYTKAEKTEKLISPVQGYSSRFRFDQEQMLGLLDGKYQIAIHVKPKVELIDPAMDTVYAPIKVSVAVWNVNNTSSGWYAVPVAPAKIEGNVEDPYKVDGIDMYSYCKWSTKSESSGSSSSGGDDEGEEEEKEKAFDLRYWETTKIGIREYDEKKPYDENELELRNEVLGEENEIPEEKETDEEIPVWDGVISQPTTIGIDEIKYLAGSFTIALCTDNGETREVINNSTKDDIFKVVVNLKRVPEENAKWGLYYFSPALVDEYYNVYDWETKNIEVSPADEGDGYAFYIPGDKMKELVWSTGPDKNGNLELVNTASYNKYKIYIPYRVVGDKEKDVEIKTVISLECLAPGMFSSEEMLTYDNFKSVEVTNKWQMNVPEPEVPEGEAEASLDFSESKTVFQKYVSTDSVLDFSSGDNTESLTNSNNSDGILDFSEQEESVEEVPTISAPTTLTKASKVSGGKGSSKSWSMDFVARDAYAEIIANEAGYLDDTLINVANNINYTWDLGWAYDWNVASGIPSTENLAIVCGGSNYSASLAGFVHEEKNIKRNVVIQASTRDVWGYGVAVKKSGQKATKIPEGGEASSSSDKGAKYRCSPCILGNNIHSVTHTSGKWTVNCECHGGKDEWVVCPHCGEETHLIPPIATNNSADGKSHDHADSASFVCQTSGCHDGSTSYNCATGKYPKRSGTIKVTTEHHDNWNTSTYTDNHMWNVVKDDKKKSQFCRGVYEYMCTFDGCKLCKPNTWIVCGCTAPAELIDDGYTVGWGHCSNTPNFIHPQTMTSSISFVEKINEAAWREITSAKIYELSYSEIEDVNTNIISNKYIGNTSSNSNVMGLLWHGAAGMVEGSGSEEHKKAGHLWYTQFKDVAYKAKTGAWVNSGPDLPTYFFGDATITMDIVCDHVWTTISDDDANKYDTDVPADTVTNRGAQEVNYWAPKREISKDWYGRWNSGDIVTDGSSNSKSKGNAYRSSVDALIAWCYTNQGKYKANVISDFLIMGVSQGHGEQNNAFQDVSMTLHCVDENEGLHWFEDKDWKDIWSVTVKKPTRKVTKKEFIEHVCRAGQMSSILNHEFDVQTGEQPVVTGYIGVQSTNVNEKYTVQGKKGVDYAEYKDTAGGFFIRGSIAGPSGAGAPQPTCNGVLWRCDGLDPDVSAISGRAPYEQVVWPDNETDIGMNKGAQSYESSWDWDGRYYGNDFANHSMLNYNDSSGYTWMHAQTNALRSEDMTRGIELEKANSYYRQHRYPFTANKDTTNYKEQMYRYIYPNMVQLGRYFVKVTDNWPDKPNTGYPMDADRASKDYAKTTSKRINNMGEMQNLPQITFLLIANMAGAYYKSPLVHSNIDIKNTAPNGKYDNAVTMYNHYFPMLMTDNESVILKGKTNTASGAVPEKIKCRTTQSSNVDINDVVIHDPISVEYCQVMGNNYGDPSIPETDNTFGYDQRIYQKGEDPNAVDGKKWYKETDETKKPNYVVVGSPFNVWVTDFGDFYDSRASEPTYEASAYRGLGSAVNKLDIASKLTGVISENGKYGHNTNYRGYQNSMDTGVWTWERLISFNFPVTFLGKDKKTYAVGSNQLINLDDVAVVLGRDKDGKINEIGYTTKRTVDGIKVNDTGGNVFRKASSQLQNYLNDGTEQKDDTFYYGLNYEFTVLPSALEAHDGKVTVWSRAINGTQADINEMQKLLKSGGTANQSANKERTGDNFDAPSYVSKTMDIEIVGRIGNIALTDVGDFRFSNLFKKAVQDPPRLESDSDATYAAKLKDTWLIEGVIKKSNMDEPNAILSVAEDISGQDTRPLTTDVNHSTMSVTNWLFGTDSSSLSRTPSGGKAAVYAASVKELSDDDDEQSKLKEELESQTLWDNLPLVASMNNIPEYKHEQLRMGYQSYFDIETIGNYYGYNFKTNNSGDTVIDKGPTSSIEDDNRTNTMTITPYYKLFDYESGEWFDVQLYYGVAGQRKLFYNGGRKVDDSDSMELYIDLSYGKDNEKNRRCTTNAEQVLTKMVNSNNELEDKFKQSALYSNDYIGTPSLITLDQFDRNFIGSNTMYGALYTTSPDLVVVKDDTTSKPNGSTADKVKVINPITVEDSGNKRWVQTNSDDYKYGLNKIVDDATKATPTERIRLGDQDFATQSQRWYFSLCLPSSTYVTVLPKTFNRDYQENNTAVEKYFAMSQLDIQDAHKKMLEEHPNSVLVCFLDIKVTGEEWTLQYEANLLNDNEFELFTPETVPNTYWGYEDEDKTIPKKVKYPDDAIENNWQCVIVYDKEKTSSDDWDTFGTH